MTSTDRIEKTIELKAPVARVWRALTDHREFGTWFRVRVEEPFVPGQIARGQKTLPGYDPQNPSTVHTQSVQKALDAVNSHIAAGENLVWDTTGVNPIVPKILQKAKAGGYQVELLHVDVDKATAHSRNASRGRSVPRWVIENVGDMLPDAKRTLAKIADRVHTVDNR